MENPFEVISRRLGTVEELLLDIKHKPNSITRNSEEQEPISLEELCKRLAISKPTAWAWEKKGIITGYHLGNRKYFIWQDVITAMTKKEAGVRA